MMKSSSIKLHRLTNVKRTDEPLHYGVQLLNTSAVDVSRYDDCEKKLTINSVNCQ
jgi:hypothetical protein